MERFDYGSKDTFYAFIRTGMNMSSGLFQTLMGKIESKKAIIGILGAGFVGYNLGLLTSKKGFTTLGLDKDLSKTRAIEEKKIPHFHATNDLSQLGSADIIIITVPTLIYEDKHPNLKPLEDAAALLKKHLKKGQLVILESTLAPGMTKEVLIDPICRDHMQPGVDFFVGYSPERIDPGNPTYTIENTPKIVSGWNDLSRLLTKAFYEKIVDQVVSVSSIEVAEFAKMLENIVRFMMINLMNEMESYAVKKKINLWEVIDAAATKPFGFFPCYPSAGIGGHCIPVNLYYLLEDADKIGINCAILKEAASFHERRIASVVDRAFEIVKDKTAHPRIFILGVAIKPESTNTAESVGLKMLRLIEKKGGKGAYHDPFVPQIGTWTSLPMTKEVLEKQDLFLIITDHKEIDFLKLLAFHKPIIDTKNVFPKEENGIYRV